MLGWLWHPVAERLSGTAPVVSWAQPAALWLVAVVIGITAWQTYRAVQVRRERLEPHRAVNRLVLARAGALVGALVAGGYAGYALSWIGDPAELAGQRILRARVVAVARRRVAIVVASAAPRASVSRPEARPGRPLACSTWLPHLQHRPHGDVSGRIRVTAAVGLIVLAALVVAGAALSGSWLLVTIAAGLGVALGAAATRITHTELVESRVEAARDRAAQAAGLQRAHRRAHRRARRRTSRTCSAKLVREGAGARRARAGPLRSPSGGPPRRPASATPRAAGPPASRSGSASAEERAAMAQLRVVELEQEVLALRAELDTVTAAWHAAEQRRRHA